MSECQPACDIPNTCAETADCQAKMHRPICTCKMGYEGNPAIKCFKPEPSKDSFKLTSFLIHHI